MRNQPGASFLLFLALLTMWANPSCADPLFSVSTDKASYGQGDSIAVAATLRTNGAGGTADGYLGVRLPGGALYCYNGRRIMRSISPLVEGWGVSDWSGIILRYAITGAEPPGNYVVYAALCAPGGNPFSAGDRYALANCSLTIRSPAAAIPYGRLRVFCSEDADLIREAHATFSIAGAFEFTLGDPWHCYPSREDFEGRLAEFSGFTGRAHASGIAVISYLAQYLSGKYGAGPEGLFLNDYYESRWSEYADYFGPRPAVGPPGWVQRDEDGNPAEYVWVPPDGSYADYENPCCPNNPHYRQYMKGVINLTCATGVDGVYLDWSTIVDDCCYCPYCRAAFEDFVSANYASDYLRRRYGISGPDAIIPPLSSADPLWFEWRIFRSRSEADFHRLIRDYARSINPGFLMSGNVYGGGGFSSAAFYDGSDIEMIGEVDDILYSELAGGTESPAEGQRFLSRNDGGTRVSNSPLIRQIVAAGGDEKPVLVYCFYPESPNPVPREEALYNLVALGLAEAFANRAAFRRVEEESSPYVKLAAADFYSLLSGQEELFSGAHTEANVAILASLHQAYGESPTYFLSAGRALSDARIPYRMVLEKDLGALIPPSCNALVLPYVPLMSDALAETMRAYVKAGGGLVSIGPSGRKDEYGQNRSELAIADVLGVSLSALPSSMTAHGYGSGKAVYIPLAAEEEERWQGFIRGEFGGSLAGALSSLPAALDLLTSGGYSALWAGHPMLELSIMRNEDAGALIAHLVNYDVTLDGAVTQKKDVALSLLLPAGTSAVSVRLISQSGLTFLPFSHGDLGEQRYVRFVIPSILVYAMADVEYRAD